jgi:hypothetical protein
LPTSSRVRAGRDGRHAGAGLTLHIDPIFVGAHHLRASCSSRHHAGIVHLFGRPQEDVDD